MCHNLQNKIWPKETYRHITPLTNIFYNIRNIHVLGVTWIFGKCTFFCGEDISLKDVWSGGRGRHYPLYTPLTYWVSQILPQICTASAVNFGTLSIYCFVHFKLHTLRKRKNGDWPNWNGPRNMSFLVQLWHCMSKF